MFCRPFFPSCIYTGLEDRLLKQIHFLAYALMIWISSDEKNSVLGIVLISSTPGSFRGKWFMRKIHWHEKGSQLGKNESCY